MPATAWLWLAPPAEAGRKVAPVAPSSVRQSWTPSAEEKQRRKILDRLRAREPMHPGRLIH